LVSVGHKVYLASKLLVLLPISTDHFIPV